MSSEPNSNTRRAAVAPVDVIEVNGIRLECTDRLEALRLATEHGVKPGQWFPGLKQLIR